MRLGLSLFLVSAVVPLGCFEEPPPESSSGATGGASTGTESDASTTAETTPASTGSDLSSTTEASTADTSTTDTSTTDTSTTTGEPARVVPLFPLTCDVGVWTGGPNNLPCGLEKMGPFVHAHDNYPLGGQPFQRVIEVRPPQMMVAPVDGRYTINTSEFETAQLQSLVGCVEDGCQVNFVLTSELEDGTILSTWEGGTDSAQDLVELDLNLPSMPGLVIHLWVEKPAIAEESRLLWFDPRVVELGG